MKKFLMLLAVGAMLMLIACGDTAAGGEPEATPTTAAEPTATITPTEIPAPTEVPAPTTTFTPTPSPTPEILSTQDVCGAAYLGYTETDYAGFMTFAKDNGILEQYPLLAEVTEENTVLASGGEWYLLVPMQEGVRFTVSESLLDETTYTLVAGKALLQAEAGEYVLLRGNVSDIYPSFMITITGPDGTVINYAPGLSLRDGALNVVEGVYDFTIYAEGQLEED